MLIIQHVLGEIVAGPFISYESSQDYLAAHNYKRYGKWKENKWEKDGQIVEIKQANLHNLKRSTT
jgi:hypothetical protein